jgi:RNA polymerase sigma factor (sigma-70 family)
MNVHFTYKLSKTPDVENVIKTQIEKLRKRLQVFKPDMISLHGIIDEGPKNGYVVSLNLRLPSGQMAARNAAETAGGALRSCFESLLEQVNKHKAQLRSQHQWPRQRRVHQPRAVSAVPFEETVASVKPDEISAPDIDEFVNANLDRLRRYVERELLFRADNGQDGLREVPVDEVLSEAVASALDDKAERPEKVAMEAWLFQLARRAIDRIVRESSIDDRDIALQSRVRKLDENTGDDDALRQFDFDADTVTSANRIADGSATPEEIFANDEIVAMVQMSLRHAKPEDREAFILFTLEGFTIRELSAITDRSEDDVRKSIRTGREMLKRGMTVSDPLRSRIDERARIA